MMIDRRVAKAVCVSLAMALAAISGGFGNRDLAPVSTNNYYDAPTTIEALKVGAGGFLRNIYIASDGTMVTRADTAGCYYYDASANNPGNAHGRGAWINVVTATSVPTKDWMVGDAHGCEEIIAYNSTKLYMNYNGLIFYSGNAGKTWARGRGFAQDHLGSQQTYSNLIAVDDQNPDLVMAGSAGNQLFITSNGTFGAIATWTGVSTLSVPAGAQMGVCVDTHSTITDGKRQIWYAWSQGNGVYKTTNAGLTWALTPNGPTNIKAMRCDSAGNVWVIGSISTIFKYDGISWSSLKPGITGDSVAIDPLNTAHVCVVGDGFAIACSANAGSTWTISQNFKRTATDIPWLGSAASFSVGGIAFDNSGILWYSEGIGIWKTAPPTTNGAAYTWISVSAAIEQLVANRVLSSPGCTSPVAFSWDRAVFVSPKETFPTSEPIKLKEQPIIGGWGGDWASANTRFLVASANSNNAPGQEISSYSSDCGVTWKPFGPTNSTRVTAGTGSKTWTNVDTTLAIAVNSDVWVYRTSDPNTFMRGRVTAYSGGILTLNVTDVTDIGQTFDDWTIHTIPPARGPGGDIAASSSSNLLLTPGGFANGVTPWYTNDGGVHWEDTGTYFNTNFGIPRPGQQFTGSVSGTLLTVTAITGPTVGSNTIAVGQILSGQGVKGNPMIASLGTGTGGTGTYNLSSNQGTIGSRNFTTDVSTGWSGFYGDSVQRGAICADRVSPNTFYTYNRLAVGSGGGVYRTQDGGATWSKMFAGTPSGQTAGNLALIKAVPGKTGHLFFSDRLGGGLTRSKDGGATWHTVSTLAHIYAFGFGATFPRQSYPAIYVVGYVGSQTKANYGVWRSIDDASTWTRVINFPLNDWWYVADIDGDKTTIGSFYGGFLGFGFFYGHL
jgi:hypothetical protein